MTLFNSEYNRKKNAFEQGILSIRRRNNFFFLNARSARSIYDLSDIRSYYTFYETMGRPQLSFRTSGGLPPQIQQDIQKLFDSIWPVEEEGS